MAKKTEFGGKNAHLHEASRINILPTVHFHSIILILLPNSPLLLLLLSEPSWKELQGQRLFTSQIQMGI